MPLGFQLVRNGTINGIVTWQPYRLSRNQIDAGEIVNLFDTGHLKEIVTESYAYRNNPMDIFMFGFQCLQAKFENDNKAIDVKSGMIKCAKKKRVSRLSAVDMAVSFATGIAKKWALADYGIKQRIQNLLFPEGLRYNRENDGYRTTWVNSVFLYLAYLQRVINKKGTEIPALLPHFQSLSGSVAGSRIELPTLGL